MADQLIQLEQWYAGQQALFAGNAAALDALQKIFQDKWVAIINGTSTGVNGTLTALQKLRDGIEQYLESLQTGSLSPLTPAQKLAQAQQQYMQEYAKALGGDQGALADISRYADQYLKLARDSFASSSQYTDIFNLILAQLSALAGGATTPPGSPGGGTGHPIISDPPAPGFPFGGPGGGPTSPPTIDALTAALPPQRGRLVSANDISDQTKQIIAALMDSTRAHADANTDDAIETRRTLDRTKVAICDAVQSRLK